MHVVIDGATCEFPAGWSVLDGSMTRRTKNNELGPRISSTCHPDDAKRLDVLKYSSTRLTGPHRDQTTGTPE